MSFKYLSFTGQRGCYAALPLSLLPGATTFTIEAKIATTSTKSSNDYWRNGHICGCEISGNWQNDFGLYIKAGVLCFWAEPASNGSSSTAHTISNAVVNDGYIHKVAVISANGAIDLFCDGVNVAHTNNVNAKITNAYQIFLAYNSDIASYLQMDLYEIRFWNVARAAEDIGADIDGTEAGLAGWYLPTEGALNDYSGNERHATLYGSPAFNEVDYLSFITTFDVQRKVHNPPLEWRYENAGDADDLILTAPILTDLPATQSKTGTAFYQTTRAKCFDLPATSEIWLKFDVYCNGSQRWRAYNEGNNGATGLTVQTSGELDFFSNDNEVYNVSGVAARLRVQTIILHMVSGSSDGFIEAWVDGNFIYKYTGDVNHGQTFADIYLQSDGSGTFFSNVIISNAPIDLDEDVSQGEVLKVDVQRNVTNSGTVLADVQRRIILPGEVTIDLQRVITNETNQILVDVQRNVTNSGTVLADVQRAVTNSGAVLVDVQRNVRNVVAGEVAIDIQRRVTNSGEFIADLQRILTCTGELFADVELNITRDWLTRILPESSFLDEKMYASAKALDVEISKLFADTRQVLHLPRLDELDGLILDILADQLHVDNYDAINFDTATKKNLIRRSIAWHRIKGTPGAVQMVLEDAFRALRIDEWFEYGGEPYYFRIYCRGYLSTPEQFGAYWRMLFDSKNVRSHLERVIIDLTEDEPIRLYTGVARFNCGQRRVKLRRPKDYVLNVDAGILKFVRGTRRVGMKDWEPLYPLADGDWLRLYFNFPTGRDHPVLLRNPQDELTKGAIRDVGTNAADNVIFMNQFAEGTLGVDRAALIKGFTVTEKNDDKVLPKDGSLRLFWAFPKGNKHKMLLHNQNGNVTLGEIRRLGLSAANDDLLRNAYNQQTSGISHVALVKNFDLNDDNRDEKVGFEE